MNCRRYYKVNKCIIDIFVTRIFYVFSAEKSTNQ